MPTEIPNPFGYDPGAGDSTFQQPLELGYDPNAVDLDGTFNDAYRQLKAVIDDYNNRQATSTVFGHQLVTNPLVWLAGDSLGNSFLDQADTIRGQYLSAKTAGYVQGQNTATDDMVSLVREAKSALFSENTQTTVVDATGQTHTVVDTTGLKPDASGLNPEIAATTKAAILDPIKEALGGAWDTLKWPLAIATGVVVVMGAAYVIRSVK